VKSAAGFETKEASNFSVGARDLTFVWPSPPQFTAINKPACAESLIVTTCFGSNSIVSGFPDSFGFSSSVAEATSN
jgi:hypothetical protein